MKKFKIFFENNQPVYSEQVSSEDYTAIKIDRISGDSKVKWLVVYAKTEVAAMSAASRIITGILIQHNNEGVSYSCCEACAAAN